MGGYESDCRLRLVYRREPNSFQMVVVIRILNLMFRLSAEVICKGSSLKVKENGFQSC